MLSNILSNKMALAAIGGVFIGALDLIMAINPNAKSNGLFHALYLAIGGKDYAAPSK